MLTKAVRKTKVGRLPEGGPIEFYGGVWHEVVEEMGTSWCPELIIGVRPGQEQGGDLPNTSCENLSSTVALIEK